MTIEEDEAKENARKAAEEQLRFQRNTGIARNARDINKEIQERAEKMQAARMRGPQQAGNASTEQTKVIPEDAVPIKRPAPLITSK